MNWGQAIKNWGQLSKWAGKTAWNNPTGRGAILGGAAGGLYGALSDNTSVLGGATMGAGLGAVGGRYGITGWRGAMAGGQPGLWNATKRFGSAVASQARSDYRGARLMANKAVNGFSALRGKVGI